MRHREINVSNITLLDIALSNFNPLKLVPAIF